MHFGLVVFHSNPSWPLNFTDCQTLSHTQIISINFLFQSDFSFLTNTWEKQCLKTIHFAYDFRGFSSSKTGYICTELEEIQTLIMVKACDWNFMGAERGKGNQDQVQITFIDMMSVTYFFQVGTKRVMLRWILSILYVSSYVILYRQAIIGIYYKPFGIVTDESNTKAPLTYKYNFL